MKNPRIQLRGFSISPDVGRCTLNDLAELTSLKNVEQILTVNWIDHPEDFKRIHLEWDATALGFPDVPIQMSANWITAWWTAFGGPSGVRLLIIREGGDIAALGTFNADAIGRKPFSVNGLRSMVNDNSSRASLLIPRGSRQVFERLASELCTNCGSYLHLGVDVDTAAISKKLSMKTGFLQPRCRIEYSLPSIDLSATWDEYLAKRSGHFRSRLRRSERDCAGLKQTVFGPNVFDPQALFDIIEEVSGQSWSGTLATAMNSNPCAWQFYRNVIADAAALGNLYAVCLHDDCGAVGFNIAVRYGSVLFGLKTAFAERVAKRGIGMAMLAKVAKYAFDDDTLTRYDLDIVTTRGDYKQRWANQVVTTSAQYLFRDSFGGRFLAVVFDLNRRLLRTAKKEASNMNEPITMGPEAPSR